MKKIIVLGAGMVGRAMAIDLAKSYDVTSVDVSKKNLESLKEESRINIIEADLADPKKIKQVVAKADLVIGAVPGYMGFEMIQTVISSGKDIVDISFFPEDPLPLNKLAKENNVTAIVDCGVAPGLHNVILGYHNEGMDIENFVCFVGGLPFKRTLPFQYKAPFSPIDVFELYTRPSRVVENGKIVTRDALSEPELMDFDEIGTLESFNTDGLRSLLKTMKIPNMKEKTLRYPGHIDLMRAVREVGFLNKEEIDLDGMKISPIDLTSKLLFPQWKYEKDEEEFTVMRVIIEGKENGRKKKYQYDLFDRYNLETHTSSMARTTGYTCTAAASMVLEGIYSKKGIIPPEYLGKDEKCFEFMIKYLQDRGVKYRKSVMP